MAVNKNEADELFQMSRGELHTQSIIGNSLLWRLKRNKWTISEDWNECTFKTDHFSVRSS